MGYFSSIICFLVVDFADLNSGPVGASIAQRSRASARKQLKEKAQLRHNETSVNPNLKAPIFTAVFADGLCFDIKLLSLAQHFPSANAMPIDALPSVQSVLLCRKRAPILFYFALECVAP